ncbi:MAG: histidinol dehydrogenase [Anaerolineae bacterium]
MIRIISDVEKARQTVLKRRPWAEVEVPPQVAEGIRRVFGEPLTPHQAVARILADVRERGDAALLDYSRRIEGVELDNLAVSAEEMDTAWQTTPAELREALSLAAERIRAFHQRQPKSSWLEWRQGEAVGQIVRPLERVGIYVPGGKAVYPSSLLMAATPAQVAGVAEIVVTSPPGPEGRIAPVILAAARIAQVERVFKLGGAQAIGALAFGTETVPRVDKIVGPGGLFPVLAMRQVFGVVGVAGLPGPTEALIIADDSARPALVAADLLAQAEHDELATPLLLTPSAALAEAVRREIEAQLAPLPRRGIIARALEGQGAIVLVGSVEEAVELANGYAPEHLCLLVRDPWSLVGQVKHAGGIFLGEPSSESLGDYVVGPSHIMPTGGTARFSSPLNVWDFLKITGLFAVEEEVARQLTPAAVAIAQAEGLTAHAAALRKRVRG